jgi:hypothetical protein
LDPGSQEIINPHRKSFLELPVLTFQVELFSGFLSFWQPSNLHAKLMLWSLICHVKSH